MLRPGNSMVVPILSRGLLEAAQPRPTTGSSPGPVSTSESQRESNPSSSSPVTSSAIASVEESRADVRDSTAYARPGVRSRDPASWRIVRVVLVHLVDGTYELFRY